jgi:hypothetical protein
MRSHPPRGAPASGQRVSSSPVDAPGFRITPVSRFLIEAQTTGKLLAFPATLCYNGFGSTTGAAKSLISRNRRHDRWTLLCRIIN